MSRKGIVAVGVLLLIAIGLAVRLGTVSNTSADWLDNVQIVEIARPIVSAGNWSANLLPETTDANGPWAFYWLGSGIQEAAYRAFGRPGVRLVGVAFLLLVAVLAWKIAGVLGALAAFSFAPLVQSVCYGRVDVIAIAFVLAGLAVRGSDGSWVLDKEPTSRSTTYAYDIREFMVGVCAACAIMSWFSAIFALPVLMPKRVRGLGFAALGSLVAVLVLWIPFYGSTCDMMFRFHLAMNSFGGMEGGIVAKLRAFAGELFTLYGFMIVVAGVLLWKSKRWFLLASMIAFALVCLFKRAYVFRSVYFLPYIVVAIAGFAKIAKERARAWLKPVVCITALAMYAQTVCLWGVRAWMTSGDRDYCAVESIMANEVGRDVGIFLDSYQLYYVGRDLGWRQFCTWCAERKGMGAVLRRDDIKYYIGNGREPDAATRQILDESGFAFEKVLVPVEELTWDSMHWWRLGPYNLWEKQ